MSNIQTSGLGALLPLFGFKSLAGLSIWKIILSILFFCFSFFTKTGLFKKFVL